MYAAVRTLYSLLYDVKRVHEAHELHFHVGPGRRRQDGCGGHLRGKIILFVLPPIVGGLDSVGALVPSSAPLGLRLIEGTTDALGAMPSEAVGAYDAAWGPGSWVLAFPSLGARSASQGRGERSAAGLVRSDRYVV